MRFGMKEMPKYLNLYFGLLLVIYEAISSINKELAVYHIVVILFMYDTKRAWQ